MNARIAEKGLNLGMMVRDLGIDGGAGRRGVGRDFVSTARYQPLL